MNQSLFITLWIIACAFIVFSIVCFEIVKRPGYKLMEHRGGHITKREVLEQWVPGRWVAPIYYSAFIGVFIAMANVLWLVLSNV